MTPAQGTPVSDRRPATARPQRQPGDRILDTGELKRVEATVPSAPSVDPRPTARTASGGIDLNPTGEMVIQLWDRDDGMDDGLFDDWEVTDAMSGMPDRSGPRIASAALILLAVLAIVLSISFVFSNRGSDSEQLVASVAHLDQVLTEFDATTETTFSVVDQAARDVLESAQLLEIGDPTRAVAIDAASQVLEGERTLSGALAYQTRFTVFMGRPALPTATDDIGSISSTYTQWSSDLIKAIEPVPSEPAFDDLRVAVSDFTERAANIQARYFDALRAGDAEGATEALAALDRRVGQLDSDVAAGVAAARTEFGTTIARAQELIAQVASTD